jgi:N-acyl-D-aspartate/D-glutamate deacylase
MKNFIKILTITLMVIFSGFAVVPAHAQDYDLVILNGRVMDPETMLNSVLNVGIKDGKIATITTDKIQGNNTINARGHVVAPGFIDTHSHSVVTELGHLRGCRLGCSVTRRNTL